MSGLLVQQLRSILNWPWPARSDIGAVEFTPGLGQADDVDGCRGRDVVAGPEVLRGADNAKSLTQKLTIARVS